MLDWLTNISNDGIALARVVVILVAIISVIITYYKTQALVPVLGAALVAGIAIWAVSPAGLTQLENWIGSDANASAPISPAPEVLEAPVVLEIPGGEPPPLVLAASVGGPV